MSYPPSGHPHRRPNRLGVLSVGVVATVGTLGGPFTEIVSATELQVTHDTANTRLRGRTDSIDHGSTDEWTEQRTSEGYLSPGQVFPICSWQGYRVFVNEGDGSLNWANSSNAHSGCFFTPQWADHPDRTTSEAWDLRFKWKSSNTGNEWVVIGTVNR